MTHDEKVQTVAEAILREAATWEEQFDGQPGQAVGVPDAAFAAVAALEPARASELAQARAEGWQACASEIAQRIEEARPHIPPSHSESRRSRVIERCTFTAATRVAREVGQAGEPK